MNRRGFLATLLAVPVAGIALAGAIKEPIVFWGPKTKAPEDSKLTQYINNQLLKRSKYDRHSRYGKLGLSGMSHPEQNFSSLYPR